MKSLPFKRYTESTSPRRLATGLWRFLADHRISRTTLTRRGFRAGRQKQSLSCVTLSTSSLQSSQILYYKPSVPTNSAINAGVEQHLYFSLPGTLNIQSDTSSCSFINNTIMNRHSPIADSLQNTMWDFSRDSGSPHNSSYHAPKIMVADAMSLTPKITEVQEFIDRNKVNLALVTETWLKSAVEDTFVDIPGFSIVRRDRASNAHGGVCLHIKDDYFRFKKLKELTCCKDHESLWVHLRLASVAGVKGGG